MPIVIQEKRDTAAAFTAANPTLLPGQIGVESDTGRIKVGVLPATAWNALDYIGVAGALSSLPINDPFSSVMPANATAGVTTIGVAPTVLDGSAAASRTTAATNRYTRKVRNAYVQSTAAVDRMAGFFIAAGSLRSPTVAIRAGFRARIAAAIADANSAGQFAIGFCATSPVLTTAAEPSAMQNCIYLGGDAGESNMSVRRNGTTGTATGTGLGAGFPHNTNATNAYELTIDFRSDGVARTLLWEARNLITDAVQAGSFADNSFMPVEGVALGEFIVRGSAAVATAPVIEFYGKQVGPLA